MFPGGPAAGGGGALVECAVVYVRRAAFVRYGPKEPAEEPDWLPLLALNRAGGGKMAASPLWGVVPSL